MYMYVHQVSLLHVKPLVIDIFSKLPGRKITFYTTITLKQMVHNLEL